jgi:catechol 2,3-dioxygenase-like lactoylglutathione lyase family enzyme
MSGARESLIFDVEWRRGLPVINAFHAIIYSHDADATRSFFRDTLKLEFADAGHGWLIFALPPAEIGVHPFEDGGPEKKHEFSLMCDDIEATVAELKGKGVEFTSEVADHGWGLLAMLKVPGAGELMLYQPRHASPLKLG